MRVSTEVISIICDLKLGALVPCCAINCNKTFEVRMRDRIFYIAIHSFTHHDTLSQQQTQSPLQHKGHFPPIQQST